MPPWAGCCHWTRPGWLTKIQATCQRQRCDKGRIERRVGRLLGQNTRAAGLFEVAVTMEERGAAQVEWHKREAWRSWATLSEGCYLLRSNVMIGPRKNSGGPTFNWPPGQKGLSASRKAMRKLG